VYTALLVLFYSGAKYDDDDDDDDDEQMDETGSSMTFCLRCVAILDIIPTSSVVQVEQRVWCVCVSGQ